MLARNTGRTPNSTPGRLFLSLGGREPRPNLGAELLHGSSEALARLARIEQLVGDAERGEDRRLLGLDDISGAHRLLDHVVDVLSHRSGALGTHVASDRILIAKDCHANDVFL